jgi:hypothetical protein
MERALLAEFSSLNQREAQRSGFALERTNNVAERMPEFTKAKRGGVCEDEYGGDE